MAVQDRVDLVGALRRLVDALRIERDDTLGVAEHLEEGGDVLLGEAGCERSRGDAAGDVARARQRIVETRRVVCNVVLVKRTAVGEMNEQAREQRSVGAGLEAQK